MRNSPVKTTIDQFMLARVTGISAGKKEKKMAIVKKQMAAILIIMPNLPSVQGPYGIGSPLVFFMSMRTMAIS